MGATTTVNCMIRIPGRYVGADFDNMLMEKARECGVEAIDGRALRPIQDGDKVVGVEVQLDDGETVEIASKVLIDASGQSIFLPAPD